MVLKGRIRGKNVISERYGSFMLEGWKDMAPAERARLKGKVVSFVRVNDHRWGRGTIKSKKANTPDQMVAQVARVTKIHSAGRKGRSLSTHR